MAPHLRCLKRFSGLQAIREQLEEPSEQKQKPIVEQVVAHQPAISFSISFQHTFNRAGGRTSNVVLEMKMFGYLAVFAVVAGCGSKPTVDRPDRTEMVGVWECSEYPAGFASEAGTRMSVITIRDDGTCSASNFPQRSPYRFINATNSTWTLIDPSMTPSGSWSIEFDGNFLQCRRNGAQLELRYLISGKDELSVNYKKAQQDATSNGG